MDEANDWTDRVDRMTAATAHEQLRAVIREAQEMLARFNETAFEHGGMLLDAQRDLEGNIDRKMARVSTDLADSIAALRERMGSLEDAHRALEDRIEGARSSAEERFDSLVARLEETFGWEERASARMVDLLATAFAGLRDGAASGHASNGHGDQVAATTQR